MKTATQLAAALLGAFALALPATAQQYPTKPVSVVVPFTPGSAGETEGRIHFAEVGKSLKQQFIFDFRHR